MIEVLSKTKKVNLVNLSVHILANSPCFFLKLQVFTQINIYVSRGFTVRNKQTEHNTDRSISQHSVSSKLISIFVNLQSTFIA